MRAMSSDPLEGRSRGSFAKAARMARSTVGPTSDLTVLIDVPPEASAERSKGAPADRIERAGRAFHRRVWEGYRRIALNEPERFVVLDGTEPIESVQSAIRDAVLEALAERVPTSRTKPS